MKNKLINKDFQKLLSLAVQIFSALEHLRECNFIHNDLKLSNVMVHEKDIIKIIDIGGMINFTREDERNRSVRFRSIFSTEGNFYRDSTRNVPWNHPKFDLFGCGKILQEIFSMDHIAEKILYTDWELYYHHIEQLSKLCLQDPN